MRIIIFRKNKKTDEIGFNIISDLSAEEFEQMLAHFIVKTRPSDVALFNATGGREAANLCEKKIIGLFGKDLEELVAETRKILSRSATVALPIKKPALKKPVKPKMQVTAGSPKKPVVSERDLKKRGSLKQRKGVGSK